MRYVWDQADAYLGRGAKRWLATPLLQYLRRFDRRTSTPQSVTRFVAISSSVCDRIARHYQRDSALVFLPVDIEAFRPTGGDGTADGGEDYYLLVGGFVPYKLESVAIEAFRHIDRKLVIAGDGPMRRELERNAPPNVQFLGHIDDDALRSLYAGCRALLYPQEEDFGIVAVEAQAAGRPVIAFGRGGSLDTVRPIAAAGSSEPPNAFASGVYSEEQTPAAIVATLQEFETRADRFDPKRIREWSRQFGIDRFREEFRREVENVLEDHNRTRALSPGSRRG